MKTVYVSGKMTGMKDLNIDGFRAFSEPLKKYCHPFLPHFLPMEKEDPTYWDYMCVDAVAIAELHGIVFMPNWLRSRGARREFLIAAALNKPMFFRAGKRFKRWCAE